MAFGRPIGGFQLVQEMIADMATDLACSRMLTYRAAAMMDIGVRCDFEQNTCKYFTVEASKRGDLFWAHRSARFRTRARRDDWAWQ